MKRQSCQQVVFSFDSRYILCTYKLLLLISSNCKFTCGFKYKDYNNNNSFTKYRFPHPKVAFF